MPKRSSEDMAARRQRILTAARTCFARKGFRATTIADLCREAGMSAGGIYTHFRNKHEIAASIGSEATDQEQPLDLMALYDGLATNSGATSSRLDLNLWAEATRDESLAEMVNLAMNRYQGALRRTLPKEQQTAGWLRLVEALTLGLEVQRALGRRQGAPLRGALSELLGDED